MSVDFMGNFAYAANFSGKNVSAYRIGPNGDLTPAPGSPFETGTAPVSIAVDPLGAFVFVANFGDNNVSAYAIGSNGGLIPVPGAPFAGGFALGEMMILQSVSGRHLSPFTIALA